MHNLVKIVDVLQSRSGHVHQTDSGFLLSGFFFLFVFVFVIVVCICWAYSEIGITGMVRTILRFGCYVENSSQCRCERITTNLELK